jgi:predicted lipoprotein with Yx(FWY)xxD motif
MSMAARAIAQTGAPRVGRGVGALLSAAGLVVVAACGANGSTSSRPVAAVGAVASTSEPSTTDAPTVPPSTAPASTTAGATTAGSTVVMVGTTSVGAAVVDQSGRTTYTFDRDTAGSGTSACLGGCAAVWPPLTAAGSPSAGAGIAGSVGVITRTDGKRQVTLNGRPLYEFSADHAAGDAHGDGFGGLWHVARPSVPTAAPARPTIAPAPPPTSAPRATPPPPTSPPPTSPPPTSPPPTMPPPMPPPTTTGGGYHY